MLVIVWSSHIKSTEFEHRMSSPPFYKSKKQLAVVFPSWNLEPFACDSQTLRTGEGWKVSSRLRFTFNKATEVESSLWSSLIG